MKDLLPIFLHCVENIPKFNSWFEFWLLPMQHCGNNFFSMKKTKIKLRIIISNGSTTLQNVSTLFSIYVVGLRNSGSIAQCSKNGKIVQWQMCVWVFTRLPLYENFILHALSIMYDFHDSTDTLEFSTEKQAIDKTFLFLIRFWWNLVKL